MRLALVHYRALPMASKVVLGLPEIQLKHEVIWKGCAKGKNLNKKFPSSECKDKRILEIVHSNVCGPMSSSSLRGYVYYVFFIDDFSHKTWIYFLKGKSEVFSKFKEYKALVENQTDRKIKNIRSDNGREFTSKEFNELCKEFDSWELHTILNRMGLQNEGTEPSWKQ